MLEDTFSLGLGPIYFLVEDCGSCLWHVLGILTYCFMKTIILVSSIKTILLIDFTLFCYKGDITKASLFKYTENFTTKNDFV